MSETPSPTRRTCAPFDHRVLRRQFALDAAAGWSVVVLVAAAVVAGGLMGADSSYLPVAIVFVIALCWIGLNAASTRAWQQVRQLPGLIEADPEEAEHHLAVSLARWPLQRAVRMLLYHRFALLRHRQQRYAETAAICRAILQRRPGTAQRVQPHLLLMLVESCLAEEDLAGAFDGLTRLHRLPLSLIETVQRMALQTRYEIEAGHHHAALRGLQSKIQLAELLPAPQAGAVHAMFALAAERSERTPLAQWLEQRADLLCGEDGLTAVGILDVVDPTATDGAI